MHTTCQHVCMFSRPLRSLFLFSLSLCCLTLVCMLTSCFVLLARCLVAPPTAPAPPPGAQSALSRSFNSSVAPLSRSLYGSCREVHGSQGSLLVFNACRAAGLRVSTSNAKGLAPPSPSHTAPLPRPQYFHILWNCGVKLSLAKIKTLDQH